MSANCLPETPRSGGVGENTRFCACVLLYVRSLGAIAVIVCR